VLGFYIYTISIDSFISNILKISPLNFIWVFIFFGCSWLLRSVRFSFLFDGILRYIDSFKIQIAGFAVNILLPGKMGDIGMALYLKKNNYSLVKSASVIIHSRLLDFTILFIIGVFGIFNSSFKLMENISSILNYSLIFIVCTLIIILLLLFFLYSNFLSKKYTRIKLKIIELIRSIIDLFQNPKKTFIVCTLTIAIWIFEALVCFTILISISTGYSFLSVLTAISFANIMKALPLLPGGIGVYETGFVLTIMQFGIPYDIAVSVAIIDHFLKKMINLGIGYPVAVNFGGMFLLSGRSNWKNKIRKNQKI
jgi:uncharacterized protein (TIRG00374 family)